MTTKTALTITLVVCLNLSIAEAGDIHDATRRGQLDRIDAILAVEPDQVDQPDADGQTPLHLACRGGQAVVVSKLLSSGADVTAQTYSGLTPLVYAVSRGDTSILNLLVEAGADPASLTARDGSLLHFAVAYEKPALVRFLIDKGLDANRTKAGMLTPLHLAALLNQEEAAESLIAAGAELDAVSSDGATPLHYAEAAGNATVAELLRAAGAREQTRAFPELRGDYMSQPKPDGTPTPFLPALFADIYRPHSGLVFSPDGNEAFWEVIFVEGCFRSTLWQIKRVDGRWQAPTVPPFAQGKVAGGPAFSVDGARLYFQALDFPPEGGRPDMNIWYVGRTDDSWGVAQPLGIPTLQPGSNEVYPSVAADGSLYFQQNGRGRTEILVSRFVDGAYTEPVKLGETINTGQVNGAPFVSPDQDRLLFHSNRHTDGFRHKLYMSLRQPDGGWGEPRGLELVDDPRVACTSPVVTPDGRYLFFGADKSINWVDAIVFEPPN